VPRRDHALVGAIWGAWLLAVLGVLVGGVESGAIADPGHLWPHYGGPLWPLFTWDYGWYHLIAISGYPEDGQGGPPYAFFPVWPLLLRASGGIADWAAALGLTVVGSAAAFAGVAAANPSGRRRQTALALACWPGSFLLLLAYPDVIALAAAAWAAALGLRGRPWLAGVLGFVAAVARPTGFLIAIPLALVTRGSRRGRIFATLAPLAGAAAVHGYFWARSGDVRAFVHAEALPIWDRNGPSRISKWPGHIADAWTHHAFWLVPLTLAAAVAIAYTARRLGSWYAAALAYVLVAGALLLAAQTPQSRIQSVILAVVAVALAVLWRFGRPYWPWALFVTAIVALSVISGSVTSFGRQAVFAFPVYWAAADGPRAVRHPLFVVAAAAANVALLLTIAKYAP
jgi:hypothetical protein